MIPTQAEKMVQLIDRQCPNKQLQVSFHRPVFAAVFDGWLAKSAWLFFYYKKRLVIYYKDNIMLQRSAKPIHVQTMRMTVQE